MARLEQLLERTSGDQPLRRDIENEIAALKERTSFGLVYDRHLPETIDWVTFCVAKLGVVSAHGDGARGLPRPLLSSQIPRDSGCRRNESYAFC